MAPLYALCPHCEFPVVVAGLERDVLRRCRQCKQTYIPEAALDQRRTSSRRGRTTPHQRARRTLRSRLRRGKV